MLLNFVEMLLKLVELLLKFVRFAMWPLRPEDETRLTGGSRGEFMFIFSAIIKDTDYFKSMMEALYLF